jgi:general secretion pathway protein D
MSVKQFINNNAGWRGISVSCALVLVLFLGVLAEAGAQETGGEEKPTQAIVEILVLEYNGNELFDLGTSGVFARWAPGIAGTDPGNLSLVDMAFPSAGPAGLGLGMFLDRISINEGQFAFLIQALEQDEKFEILSRPRLLLEMGGEKMKEVKTVQRVPYETTQVVGTRAVQVTKFRDTGVTLSAKLDGITDDGYLELHLVAKVGALGPRLGVALAEQPPGSVLYVPEFFDRSIITDVVLADRQVLVIGALLSTEDKEVRRGVPVLSEIPVLKYLFGSVSKQKSYRELIFFVKPMIYRVGSAPRVDFDERELKKE